MSNFLRGKREVAKLENKKARQFRRAMLSRVLFEGNKDRGGVRLTYGQCKNWAARLVSEELRKVRAEAARKGGAS